MAWQLLALLLPGNPFAEVIIDDDEPSNDTRAGATILGLPYYQAQEVILKHERRLRAQKLFVNAAEVRKLAETHFPEAFAWTAENTSINLLCPSCGSPINNPADKLSCESCGERSAGCAFCEEKDSPFPLPGEHGEGSVAAAEALDEAGRDAAAILWRGGERLWNWCPQCGHCMHVACAEVSAANILCEMSVAAFTS